MNEEITIAYWKIRGLGARVRLLLEYTGIAYKEKYYVHETKQSWWNGDKQELQKKNSCITLPYIIDGDKTISESDGCIVYIIHKSGKLELLGRNAEQQVNVATMMGVFRDLYKTYLNFIYGPNHEAFTGNLKGTFEEARAEYAEKFKPFLNKLSSFIGEKNYYCGDITYVDFVIAEFIQQLNEMDPSLFENENKNVLNHQKRIWELPAIKSYLQSDRWLEKPANYVFGRWGC